MTRPGLKLSSVLAVLALAACAPQPASMAVPAPAAAPMADHNHADTTGMMAHCAQMRQSMRPGMAMSPDMKQMMDHCDEMGRSMGAPPRTR